tara:strand:- start:215 stop:664 length:450 start_codon:yes stop_codon:yes gene_type:complete
MKKFYLLFLFILTSCSYEAIYSSKENDFAIIDIELINQNKVEKLIARNLKNLTDKKNKNKFYKLKIKGTKEILIVSKDNTGDAKIFNMSIKTNISILKDNKEINNLNLSKNFSYKNMSNKFDLKQYENNIQENLINEIIKDINLKLHSI